MKIKQLISYPNPNELGLGNTNETYIRVENNLDVSDIFPPLQEIEVVNCMSHKTYSLKAKDGNEFRINQLGQLYRDYNVCPGDEIKFTQIDNGNKSVLFTVVNYNRVFLSVTSKGTEIVNIDRLAPFANANNGKEFVIKINEGTLKLTFDKSERKRSDSPAETDFYKTTVNDVAIEKGSYYITIRNGKNIIEEVVKNRVEEYIVDENTQITPITTLDFSLQQIFYGAPGTGKSHGIKDKENLFAKVIRTTFHPDSDYSTFVGAYKPTMEDSEIKVTPVVISNGISLDQNNGTYKEKRIAYTFVKQAFLKAYIEAWKRLGNEENVLLVIEEINRGNCAQIFGDLFQLLDRNDKGFSDYPIQADEDLRKVLADEFADLDNIPENVKSGEELLLPNNLYIWATMNTSDQSLFPIDSAFKRRWDWKYMKIKDGKLDWKIDIELNGEKVDWWTFMQKINAIIASMTSSADKQQGYFFCKADRDGLITAETFVSKVIFYLWNDVFKDYGFEDASLFRYNAKEGDKEVEKDLTFPDFYDEDGENVNTERLADFVKRVMNWQKQEANL